MRMKPVLIFVIPLLLVISIHPVSAQQTIVSKSSSGSPIKGSQWLKGTATWTDGTPIPDVKVINGCSGMYQSAITDSAGNYALEGLWVRVIPMITVNIGKGLDYRFLYVKTNRSHNFRLKKPTRYLKVKVLDESGQPIEGCSGYIPQTNKTNQGQGPTIYGITANEDGVFEYKNLVDTHVDLEITKIEPNGFFGRKKVIENLETNREYTFTLKKSDRVEWHIPKTPLRSQQDARAPFLRKKLLALMNNTAPALNIGQWLNGKPLGPDELKGKVVVLQFWSIEDSWTMRLSPFLSALHEAYASRGVVCIGLHEYRAAPDSINQIINEKKLNHRIAIDRPSNEKGSCGLTFDAFGVYRPAKPDFIILDRQGKVHIPLNECDIEAEIIKWL